MKKLLRWAIAVTLLLLLLAILALCFRDTFFRLAAREAIHSSTGLRVEIAKIKTGLRQPAIEMHGLKIYNYADFGNSLLLDVPDLTVEFDQQLAAEGKLRFKLLRVNLAELHVIRDSAGRWNLEKVEKEMTDRNVARVKRGKPKLQFAGIDEMELTIGRVTFRDAQKPDKSKEILVGIRNEFVTGIKTDEDLQEWIGGFIFKVILQEAITPTAKRKGKPVQTLKDALEK
jgi:uncharacterized protein involved in outer membrane biogenesis